MLRYLLSNLPANIWEPFNPGKHRKCLLKQLLNYLYLVKYLYPTYFREWKPTIIILTTTVCLLQVSVRCLTVIKRQLQHDNMLTITEKHLKCPLFLTEQLYHINKNVDKFYFRHLQQNCYKTVFVCKSAKCTKY